MLVMLDLVYLYLILSGPMAENVLLRQDAKSRLTWLDSGMQAVLSS